jgi:polysaccharide biosynthesis transport protein
LSGKAALRRRQVDRYVAVLVRWGWFVLLCAIIGAGSAYAVAKTRPALFRATTLLLVHDRSPTGDPYTSVLASNQLVQTYVNLIQTSPVLDPAARQVGGISSQQLGSHLHVSNPGISTQIIQVQVDDRNPGRAAQLTNAVAASFIAALKGAGSSTVSVFQTAVPPTQPVRPSRVLYAAIGGLAGLLLAAGLVLFLESLDDRIRNAEDVARATDLATLGALSDERTTPLLTTDGRSYLGETFRALRTNLAFATLGTPVSTIVVTSAMAGEGKTTVATNLAASFAADGKRVLLIDADLRRPSIHERLDLPNDKGLTQCLLHGELNVASMSARMLQWPSLWVLTSGPLPPDPTAMLASASMRQLIQRLLPSNELVGQLDMVVIDTPPVVGCVDAAVLAASASATLLVVNTKRCHEDHLVQAHRALTQVRARIAGVVLNQVQQRSAGMYPYGYADALTARGDAVSSSTRDADSRRVV